MPNDPQAASLLAHIVAQTKSNIHFLESHNYMSPNDASVMMSKLSEMDSWQDILRLSDDTQKISLNSGPAAPASRTDNASTSVARRNVPTPHPPQPTVQRARALWAYNENNQEPNDLSFHPGDIIELVSETNSDWWTGRLNGRQGLFPSNYVEKLPSDPIGIPPPSLRNSSFSPVPRQDAPSPWQPSPGPPGPPGPPLGYNDKVYYAPQVPPPQVVVVDNQQQAPPKKHRFGGGGLGNTLAQSAVGGLGFGAGAAIGGDLINAIF